MGSTKLRKNKQSVVLCILDGWGERHDSEDNAIAIAKTPNWDRFAKLYPKSTLNASGASVGLPPGQMGNSEVGHMSIGSGRIVLQDLPRIDRAIADRSLAQNKNLKKFVADLKISGKACHILGLLSPGGVHSHIDHVVKLSQILDREGVPVRVHCFLDGRDTSPRAGKASLNYFLKEINNLNDCKLSSISGRYWAMDRDSNWDRVAPVYDAIMSGKGRIEDNLIDSVSSYYEEKITDEFITPTVSRGYSGMVDGDALFMANFRADRARQILTAFVEENFTGFLRSKTCNFSSCLGMVEYSSKLNKYFEAIFPAPELEANLGQVISEAEGSQLRIAETEKYAHVTYFFSGGREKPFIGEHRILVKSPNVSTYDLKPEMSAFKVTDKLVEAIKSRKFDLIVVNYANGDMVGHTGCLKAAVKAVDTIDKCLGKLETAIRDANSVMLVTADHGNCETMYDTENQDTHTQHTLNRVPILLVNAPFWVKSLRAGGLSDIAPTVLQLFDLPKPSEMTGTSLINEKT